MKSASQLLHAALGAPRYELPAKACGPIDPQSCWICGGTASRGMLRDDWQGATFTGQNRVRAWASPVVCEPCVAVTAWDTPMVMAVPGADAIAAANAEKKAAARAAKVAAGQKVGNERDLGWRLFSVLYDDGVVIVANKGQKAMIRDWLRAQRRGTWFAAIADSGQKHVVPWAPVNARAGRRVLFEERELTLPDANGWTIVDDLSALLTAGATKDEILTGDYGVRAWTICAEAIEAFEARWSRERASAWWDLALWLAQRDEAAMAARIEAEKAAKAAKAKGAKNAGRETKAGARGTDSGGDPRPTRRVPGERRERAGSLEPTGVENQQRGEKDGDSGGVVHAPAAKPVPARAHGEQLSLL